MDTLQWAIFGVVMLGAVVALWLGSKTATRKRVSRFQDRPEMNDEEFFSTYYSDTGIAKEIVLDTLRQVASATEIPATKLRPSDRFDRELAPVKGWEFGDGLVELAWFVNAKKKKAGVSEMEQVHTMDDLIRYVARLEVNRRSL